MSPSRTLDRAEQILAAARLIAHKMVEYVKGQYQHGTD
jgi:hypothetical protein